MQSVEISLLATIIGFIIAVAIGLYLLRYWYKQEKRLSTDLPLMFGIAMVAQSLNQLMLTIINLGILDDILSVFRIRSFVVLGSTLPMLGAIVHIWVRRSQRTQHRILAGLTIYWMGVALLGPSREFIITLHMPVLLILMIGLIGTFAVTWRTGRLKEVRSELMVFAMIISSISQLTIVPFLLAGLAVVSNVLNLTGMIIATLALVNPWYNVSIKPAKPNVMAHN